MGIGEAAPRYSVRCARLEASVGTVVEMRTRSARPSPESESEPPDESYLPNSLRVLIADDEPEVREILISVVDADPGLELAGVAPDAHGGSLAHDDRGTIVDMIRAGATGYVVKGRAARRSSRRSAGRAGSRLLSPRRGPNARGGGGGPPGDRMARQRRGPPPRPATSSACANAGKAHRTCRHRHGYARGLRGRRGGRTDSAGVRSPEHLDRAAGCCVHAPGATGAGLGSGLVRRRPRG
jgi:hypothetical protein